MLVAIDGGVIFSQLVQLVQSRSGLRQSNVQFKVGLCMINRRAVLFIYCSISYFSAQGFECMRV